jgi:hypothetical protein
MTLPAYMNIRIVTDHALDHATLKRKPTHREHGSPDRSSPNQQSTDSPISPSRKRPTQRVSEDTKPPTLSLFDLARCLSESRDYDYPNRFVHLQPFVHLAFD